MFRREFAYGLLALASLQPALVAAAAEPCTKNQALPYDHPLEMRMRALDGPDFVLSKFRGAVVWINVFATWCRPCNMEQPFVVSAAQEYFSRGVRVIGINYMESDDTVRGYRKKYGMTFPVAMDMRGGFANALEVGRSNSDLVFPAHLFISRDGFLSCYVMGSMAESHIRRVLEELLTADEQQPAGATPAATPATTAPQPSPPSARAALSRAADVLFPDASRSRSPR